ncbi:GerAB/ArcD/ProY family transporter [Ruminococcus sp. Marseille-P6503]|uniref:GerAB/ArcD/ProY family transporter n=1 Tax=Ruminococcus sp. Marseille-P6503 TaxID=2364796 RepID=UPI000F5474C6|nr:GerAB/ArcD/ProY family transporter [Ruminococcus sp. Marseille-P6503]
MKKITPVQMVSILICCLFYTLMTYIPPQNDNAVLLLCSKLLTLGIQCVLLIPLIKLYAKTNGKGIIETAFAKSRTAGCAAAVIYLLFSIFILFITIGDFAFFLRYSFASTYSEWSVVLVFSLASVYVASMGVSSGARTAVVTAFITVAGTLLVITGFKGVIDFRALNLAAENRGEMLADGILSSFSRSDELVLLALLLPYLKSKPGKTVYSYIAAKAVLSTVIIIAIAVILGDFAIDTKLPFFALSAYSKNRIFERFDAFFLMFWVMCALIKASVALICISDCFRFLFPKTDKKLWLFLPAFFCGSADIILIMLDKWEVISYKAFSNILIVILVAALPLAVMLFRTRYTRSKTGGTK